MTYWDEMWKSSVFTIICEWLLESGGSRDEKAEV